MSSKMERTILHKGGGRPPQLGGASVPAAAGLESATDAVRDRGADREVHFPEPNDRAVRDDGRVTAGPSANHDGSLRLPLERPLAELVSEYEKGLIESALRATRGNRSRAAKLLQTTERIIGYRVQQYGIDCRHYRD
jgi:DNA-binding NtrC family response regulator